MVLNRLKEGVSLKALNTMGLQTSARYFLEIHSAADVQEWLKSEWYPGTPFIILGGGSNVLFLEESFEGIILKNCIKGIEVMQEDDSDILLKAGGGENWHKLVQHCVSHGWGGIENLSLIPGSVGAAPIQNIGAYGVELEEVFEQLEAVMLESGELRSFSREECGFGYRDSIFKKELKGKVFITSVTLRLKKNPVLNTSYRALQEKMDEKGIKEPGIKDISDAVIEIRSSKLPDPDEIGNTGSFFKNPVISRDKFQQLQSEYPAIPNYPAGDKVKVPAAWLIDQCGWKGRRFGDAGVHRKQALVLVNYGNAEGKEIWELAGKIRQSVNDAFGIMLHPEVNII